MDYDLVAKTMHPLERAVLPHVEREESIYDICKKADMKEVEVIRALQWMRAKDLVEISETKKEIIFLTDIGKKYSEKSLPEHRFLVAVQTPTYMKDIQIKASLSRDEFNVSIGMLRKQGMISIESGEVRISSIGKGYLKELEIIKKLLSKLKSSTPFDKISKTHTSIIKELHKRGIIEIKQKKTKYVSVTPLGIKVRKNIRTDMIDKITTKVISSGSWKNNEIRPYDLFAQVPEIHPGKKHFIRQAIDKIRRIWIEMGFKEMRAPMVELSFWNFDALFTPQDHPAREMQDTFFMKNPEFGNFQKIRFKQ